LDALQGGPFFEEVGGQGAAQVHAHQFRRLGKNGFEMGQQFIGQGRAPVHEVTALFVQERQLPCGHGVGLPGTQMVSMFDQQIQDQIGIDRIVLGPAGVEGLAKTGHALGIDGIGDQMLVLQQSGQERAAGLFQGDGDFTVWETGAEAISPLGQGFGSLFQAGAFDRVATGDAQAYGVFFVAPINANEGGIDRGDREGGFCFVTHKFLLRCLNMADTLAWTQRRTYSGDIQLSASEYSSRVQTPRWSEALRQLV
jgi:hypothetical protein